MRKNHFILVLGIFLIAMLFFLNRPDKKNAQEDNVLSRITPTVKAVEKVLPSVVNIGTERVVTKFDSPWGQNDPFEGRFRDFFARQPKHKESSLGSGAIINKKGLILTNAHVVSQATRILVTTSDGSQYLAKEIATDDFNDIALLKLLNVPKEKTFTPIEFSSPGQLYLGETVIVFGNPYGLGSTVSKGILSANRRKVTYRGRVIFNDILQTDAPINPGNSGGPLVDINGNMIGINTAIHKQASDIGFAIPLKRIENILANWLIPERFAALSLGIIPGEKIINGKVIIYLKEIISKSPAANSTLKVGDEILQFNGEKVDKLIKLSNKLSQLKGGEVITLNIKGKGSVKLKVEQLEHLNGKKLAEQRLGITTIPLTIKLAKTLNYPFHGGLLISDINNLNSSLKRGDMIIKLGDIPIYNYKDLHRALSEKYYGDTIKAIVIRIHKNGTGIKIYKRIIKLNIK